MHIERHLERKSLKDLAVMTARGGLKEWRYYDIAILKNITHERAEKLLDDTCTAIEREQSHGVNYKLDFTQKAVMR